jgi:hypothetical protein
MTSLKTAKLLILAAAGLSFLFSVYLWFLVDKEQGVFVGLWGAVDFVIWRLNNQQQRTVS